MAAATARAFFSRPAARATGPSLPRTALSRTLLSSRAASRRSNDGKKEDRVGVTLYNTLGREYQPFEPLEDNKAGFYGCGPTVYDYAHIGNIRAYVTHDTLVRVLRYFGYDVTYVMNITDVGHLSGDADSGDDKMVKAAVERGKTVWEIAEFYTAAFFKDTERMNIGRPDVVCKATDHVDDMIALIRRIEANGFTYQAGGNLYFDVTKFPSYGELARVRLEDLKAGARVEVDANKKHPADFALWFTKSKFENQAMLWDSPWGRGYPGWHIECSAMSMKYLGESFDLHAGGIDHIAIHHTNEIAQSEAATGKKWVKYWLHNEFLNFGKMKMAKSSGDFLTVQTLVDRGYEPLDYRYFLLGAHYRQQLAFTWEGLDSAMAARAGLVERVLALAGKAAPVPVGELGVAGRTWLDAFREHAAWDMSMPRVLADLWGALKDPALSAGEALALALEMDKTLGLGLEGLEREDDGVDPERAMEIDRLVAERAEAKKARDFARADAIRAELASRGIALEDGPSGTVWKRTRA
jgi:cysteinyl-tRNA synthetase